MTKEVERMVYGLTPLQQSWSRRKLRSVLDAKWPARKAKNHFYAELLRRRRRSA